MDEATPAIEVCSKPPMRFRRTRIVVSVFFALATVVLCMVTALSFCEGVALVKIEGTGTETRYGIDEGYLYMCRGYIPGATSHEWRLNWSNIPQYRFEWVSGYAHRKIIVPGWVAVAVLAGGVYVPWARFSLRRLLIATTLVAVVLGLGVWLGS